MGALIMAHSDDDGLVLPPALAPIQVVIVPIFKTDEQKAAIALKAVQLKKELIAKGISVKFDDRDNLTPGYKFADYELKGVPLRIAIGPRDLENGTVELARRDTKTKSTEQLDGIVDKIGLLLDEIQAGIYDRALKFREENTRVADSFEEFKKLLEEKEGFIYAHWDGTSETEKKIKEETKATIRCIPLGNKQESGKCIYSGKPSGQRVLFAKAY
jgi:prolyl-tRNA synthetase